MRQESFHIEKRKRIGYIAGLRDWLVEKKKMNRFLICGLGCFSDENLHLVYAITSKIVSNIISYIL